MGITYPMLPEGLCNQVPTVTQTDASGLTSGDEFPIGTTVQSYVISDQLGNTMECSFNLVVNKLQGTHDLACQDTLNVSVEFNCQAAINPDMLLEGDNYGCYDHFTIEFSDPGVVYVNGILEAHNHIGQYLHACITDNETGNFCCSVLLIEDKLPPVLTCSEITLNCTDNTAPQAIPHFPVPQGSVVT